MILTASSPGSALPLAAITRRALRSYLSIVSGASSRMRWSMTGTTTSAVHSCWAVALSVSSGSNLRRRTSVEPRPMPSVKCAKPQEWNIGAAIIVRSPACSGIFENSAAAGSSDSGCLRCAPFGVPVVPLVRMTTRPFSAGGTTSSGSPASIRSSSSGSLGLSSPSFQAMKRLRRSPASCVSPSNSSS